MVRRLGKNSAAARGAASNGRAGVLLDYAILVAIGRLLTTWGWRSDDWITDCHRKVAYREDLDYDELREALATAAVTWYACGAISVPILVADGLASNAIEGRIHGVALDVFAALFGLPIFVLVLAVNSAVRTRLLMLSGRVRKKLADEVKVKRYRPLIFDFWGAAAAAVVYILFALIHW